MLIACAVFLDCLFGDPRKLPHPVVAVGKLIALCERALYRDTRAAGFIVCAAVLLITGAAVQAAVTLASRVPYLEFAVTIYFIYSALAYRSLKDESYPVFFNLCRGDLVSARHALSYIVGRDTESLDEGGIVRATVETVAENYIDGIVSVIFYAVLGHIFGASALFVWFYKAASTMDSMIGYDDSRYRNFGYAAAKLDDALNFVPARLGGAVAVISGACAGYDGRRGARVFLRDRLNHKSPNSAHGESAFAGLLGIRLGGGAWYGSQYEEKPSMGDPVRDATREDIIASYRILDASVAACALMGVAVTL